MQIIKENYSRSGIRLETRTLGIKEYPCECHCEHRISLKESLGYVVCKECGWYVSVI
jgi:hypothetical protein